MSIDFTGKRALVTGAGKGLGRGIALALAKCGAETFAISRTQADLDSLKAENPAINTICLDISHWDATRKCVTDIGNIDLLVNNAGVLMAKPVFESTEEDFDTIFATNVKAMVNITQVVGQNMVSRKVKGSIVNISSIAGIKPLQQIPVYSMSKSAVEMVTKIFALELGPNQIRVNNVNPGPVLTPMGEKAWANPDDVTKHIAKVPMRSFQEVDDITNATLFLLSDNASMITGHSLPVDGGFSFA